MESDTILRVIYQHSSRSAFSVEELTAMVPVSYSRLYELTYRHFSMSPQKLIETVRIERFLYNLAHDPDLTLYRVAHAIGYINMKSFRGAVRRRLNLSPRECKDIFLHTEDPKETFNALSELLWERKPQKWEEIFTALHRS
jgi:transcriptional regulator GlxA family with amidase domain